MKRLSGITMGLLVIGATVLGCAQMSGPGDGWITLIDGTTGLDNWNRLGDANWRAEDGAIVDFAKVEPMPKAGGKWNVFEITAKGPDLTVVLNGVQTVSVKHWQFPQGPFALQFGNGPKDAPGGAIKWRKVQIREL